MGDASTKTWTGSRMYGFVRGRQLEGTFPGDPATGIWPITGLRIGFGWGMPPEESWPYDGSASAWPPSEPPNVDADAKPHRGGRYQRVRTLEDCRRVLAVGPGAIAGMGMPVMVSLNVTEGWRDPPGGRIPESSLKDDFIGTHSVLLVGYDDHKQEFTLRNSWGAGWGDKGYGYICYRTFDASWIEGWLWDSPESVPIESCTGIGLVAWGIAGYGGAVYHHRAIVNADDERIGWAFALEREGVIELEELFVKPQFRRRGHGATLLDCFCQLASERHVPLKTWISLADNGPENLLVIERLIRPRGLYLKESEVRWAARVGSTERDRPFAGLLRLFRHRPASTRPRPMFHPVS